MLAQLFMIVVFVAALYALLRFVFPRTGETPAIAAVLAFLGIAFSTSFLIGLVAVVAVAYFREKVAAFLTECGCTRDRVEALVKGAFNRRG